MANSPYALFSLNRRFPPMTPIPQTNFFMASEVEEEFEGF